MTQQPNQQQPYAGAPGQQDQIPYGAQQPQYGGQQQAQNPYAQAPQNPYGQQPQNPYGQQPQNPYGTGGPANYGPPPKKRNNLMIIRLVVVVGVLALAGGGWAYNNAHKAKRGSDGTVNKTGNLDAFSIKVGDCYEKPKDALSGFDSVKAIPCNQPHNAQVYYSFVFPNAGSTAPTDTELSATVDPQCTDAAKTKVDETKAPQDAMMNYLVPDSTAWGKGHHDILCVIENETDFSTTVLKS